MIGNILKKALYYPLASRINQFYADLEDPALAQHRRLINMIEANTETQFGREHDFANIKSTDDYRKAVPISSYNDFLPYIEKMKNGAMNILVSQPLEMFGVTSGSSAKPKFLPITRRFTVEYHNAHLMWMYHMLRDRPESVVGASFSMVSPAVDGITPGGTPYGASSGKQYRDQSIPIRMVHPVPYDVFLAGNCIAKYHAALAFALGSDLRVVNSVNPSTLVLLATVLKERAEALLDDLERGEFSNTLELTPSERVTLSKRFKARPKRARFLRSVLRADKVLLPKNAWPNICAINTWQGGNSPFYLSRVKDLWGDATQRCLGLRSTEGMFSIPLSDNSPSGALAVSSHFMEFVEDGKDITATTQTLLAHELEAGKRYRLIITTSAGLYRYDLGDVVEVTGYRKNTPEIAFLHKAGGVLSVTGEKVYEDQVVAVMAAINSNIMPVLGFTVTLELHNTPRYIIAIELPKKIEQSEIKRLAKEFDKQLSTANIEYRDKRNSRRLAPPAVLVLEQGSYRKYREMLINMGRPDGQIKPPHMVTPPSQGPAPVKGCKFFDHVTVSDKVILEEDE